MARKLTDADRAAGIRTLARMLDSAVKIPGTGIRFGAESVFGLIPVVGDIAGAALSGYIVLVSARLGAPASTIVRMMVNIGIDTVVGAVPILGDLFDVGWRANMRNVELLDSHLVGAAGASGAPGAPGAPAAKKANRWVTAGVLLALVLLAIGAVWLSVAIIRFIAGLAMSPS
jgi:hypothetical protein